jgi:hypothetical protein
MDRQTAVDCLAIPVAGAMATYDEPEAILFGLVYGIAIGKGHVELANALTEVGVNILIMTEGTVPTAKDHEDFNDRMNDIIEVMTALLK